MTSTTDSDLKVSIEKPGAWARKLTITVPAQRLEQERHDAARRLAQKIRLPGFRKGKVPTQVLEKKFGPAVEQEMLERVMGAAYREAVTREGLKPISQASIENVHYHAGADLTFDVQFEVRPEIELNRLGGFHVKRERPNVSDDDVSRVLDRLREEHAVWKPLEQAQSLGDGDMATVEITSQEGASAGQPRRYQIQLGRDQVRAEIEEAVRTLAVGEQGEFTINLPEGQDETVTRPHRLTISLVEGKTPEYPAVDDEFARGLGDFADLQTLKERVREDLEKEAATEGERALRQQLVNQIVAANPFEVPEAMVQHYIEQLIRPRKDEDPERLLELKDAARPVAEQALHRMLLIDRVAEVEGLRATPSEVDARIEVIAQRLNKSEAEVRAQFQKSGRLGELEEQITEEKVFDYLKSLSIIE